MKLLDLLFNAYVFLIPKFWVRDIVIDGELYLRRLFLTPHNWRTRVFIHHIRKSDVGQFQHDHPWPFTSFVLWGNYEEDIPSVETAFGTISKRKHGWLTWHRYKANDSHLVRADKQVVTLCFVGRATRVWGFHTTDGWVDWRTHLGLPTDAPTPPEDQIRNNKPRGALSLH